ncbi:RNA-binding protein [Anatilimnocola floriformis]|uniref:RNA-binding protein n=1 Tax=Anatilimnocola floriformis TaxID=2948575 RepID=UPI0020C325DC|nr:RNA-binding protein [Anatilimnocola floriformis]
MANKSLFQSIKGALLPPANARNEAGGLAYSRSAEQALAQYAVTGCLNSTFYATGDEQLAAVLKLCQKVAPEFIARVALYSRQKGFMKDMPALLLAVLSVKGPGLMAEIFDRVIDSPKMLRNFVQIMRSGVVGRKSLGTLPKRLIQQWIESRSDVQLFAGSVGNDPSLADVIKLVHPKPATTSRAALFAYLLGRKYIHAELPEVVQEYEVFKTHPKQRKGNVPNVPFQMLTSLPLAAGDWKQIARNAPWQMTRMNLNTFERHEVFKCEKLVELIANRLRNPRLIEEARVFPYQLLAAFLNASETVPHEIREALQDAMELAISNVPHVPGRVVVCPDVSGSMHSPVTGVRVGATSKVRCIDVAALVAAAILRRNPRAEVIPFESDVVRLRLNPRDSVMTSAKALTSLPAGGTNCSAPLKHLNERKASADLIVYVSDNESWIDSGTHGRFGGSATATLQEWAKFKQRNPHAKMVCIDLQPTSTTQAPERADIINVGGFSDQVFTMLADVANGSSNKDHWVREIQKMKL